MNLIMEQSRDNTKNKQFSEADTLLSECVSYFKSRRGFDRVFFALREKYRSLGRCGGRIALKNPSEDEKEVLGGLLRRAIKGDTTLTIRADELQKALELTRFKDLRLEDVLMAYFEGKLITKKEEERALADSKSAFFKSLSDELRAQARPGEPSSPAEEWLRLAEEGKRFGYLAMTADLSPEGRRDLSLVCSAINELPSYTDRIIRLAVFATEITKNPHAFDRDTRLGKLLLHGLSFVFDKPLPSTAEEASELYYQGGLMADGLSSYVAVHGLRAGGPDGLHPAIEAYFNTNEDYLLTISNVSRLKNAYACRNKAFIVENPNVFSTLTATETDKKFTLLCTFGQLKLSALVLLDLLYESGCELYYSGDCDPEGILIAYRLRCRYGDRLNFWRFSCKDYEEAMSDVVIEESRLKQLDRVEDEALEPLISAIRSHRRAGYQEMLTDRLMEDIMSL